MSEKSRRNILLLLGIVLLTLLLLMAFALQNNENIKSILSGLNNDTEKESLTVIDGYSNENDASGIESSGNTDEGIDTIKSDKIIATGGGGGSGSSNKKAATINGSADDDKIIVVGTVTDINGNEGNDEITIQAGGTVTGTINGGAGADNIYLNNKIAKIQIKSGDTGVYSKPEAGATFSLDGIDRIDNPGTGTTFDLGGGWGIGTLLTVNNDFVDVTDNTIQWIRGTVDINSGIFTANDFGTDALIVYDADHDAGPVTAQAVVLTNLAGSAIKGVITNGGLTITNNAAPVVDLISTETNNVIVGKAADLPDFTVSDADGDDLTITLTAVNGQISWDRFSWADTIKMGFDRAKDINDALADLQFKAAQAGDASITIAVTDKWGSTDSKAYNYLKATDSVVNTAPTISGIPKALQRISFETETALADFKVSDTENNALTVTLAASGGDLSGVTDADDQAAGIQLKGSASAINTALANLKFKTTARGDASISITVEDEYGATSAATYALFTPYDTTLDLGNDESARVIGNSDLNYAFTNDWRDWPSFTDPVIVDAEKNGNEDGSQDDNMDWAATAANLLTWSGWAEESIKLGLDVSTDTAKNTAEDVVFAEFVNSFTLGDQHDGHVMYGIQWFFNGDYPPHDNGWPDWDMPKDGTGDYLGFSATEYIGYEELEDEALTESAIYNSLEDLFDQGYALGLSIGWYASLGEMQTESPTNPTRAGGHAITCWGYTYDNKGTIITSDDVLTGLIVSDSDDGMKTEVKTADDRLKILELTWDATTKSYYTNSYSTLGKIESICYVDFNSAYYAADGAMGGNG